MPYIVNYTAENHPIFVEKETDDVYLPGSAGMASDAASCYHVGLAVHPASAAAGTRLEKGSAMKEGAASEESYS